MLNVAVSRAKDTFAVIGDMRLFHSKGETPSAILGNSLFDEDISELTDVEGNVRLPQEVLVQGERIADLAHHRDILRNALSSPMKGQRIVIASPWITLNAINDDNLVSLIEGAVKVKSYFCWKSGGGKRVLGWLRFAWQNQPLVEDGVLRAA